MGSCFILNLSVMTGSFPDSLKLGFVTPLHKMGDPENVSNYRSVTGLSSVSKLFEKAVLNRLNSFLNKYNLITENQHGFRSGLSTSTAAFELIQFIHESINNNNYTLALFFDLTRAFDCVSCEFLVRKLDALGVRGSVGQWIESFLTNRKIIVKLGQTFSRPVNLCFGVPQGSVLSPLLFLIFINDISDFLVFDDIVGRLILYADDTTVCLSAASADDLKMKADHLLNTFSTWCSKNKLLVNPSKTHYMVYFKRRSIPDFQLTLNGQKIERLRTCSFLGLIIDEQMTWGFHIDHVIAKLNSTFFAITNLKNLLTISQLLTVYYALGYSHLRYMILYWGQTTELQRVFVVQKRIIRKIFSMQSLESCRPVFKKHGILPLPCIIIFEAAMFVRRNPKKFQVIHRCHPHSTRSSVHDMLLPHFRVSAFKKSPLYFSGRVYNSLPSFLKEIQSLPKFRRMCKAYLSDMCFYSLQEFFNS